MHPAPISVMREQRILKIYGLFSAASEWRYKDPCSHLQSVSTPLNNGGIYIVLIAWEGIPKWASVTPISCSLLEKSIHSTKGNVPLGIYFHFLSTWDTCLSKIN